MAQVKLLFPLLSNASGLFSFIAPHSALLSLALPEEHAQEAVESCSAKVSPLVAANNWTNSHQPVQPTAFFEAERASGLRLAMEEDNDY